MKNNRSAGRMSIMTGAGILMLALMPPAQASPQACPTTTCKTQLYDGTRQYFGLNASWNRGNVQTTVQGSSIGRLDEYAKLQAHCFSGLAIYTGYRVLGDSRQFHVLGLTEADGSEPTSIVPIVGGNYARNAVDTYAMTYDGASRYAYYINGYYQGTTGSGLSIQGLSCIALQGIVTSSYNSQFFDVPSTISMTSQGRTATGAALPWATASANTDHPPFQGATYGNGSWSWNTG